MWQMNVEPILSAVTTFFLSTKLHIILALILIDVILAVAVALRTKTFDFTRLGEFLSTMILPYVMVYLVIHLVSNAVSDVSEFLGIGLDTAIFAIITASLVAAIFDNLKNLGMNLPSVRQTNAVLTEDDAVLKDIVARG